MIHASKGISMDSITQFVLGSSIAVSIMGKRAPVWKSVLIGGAIATLPDLDAFIDHGDPIRNMTFHRGETHAFFYQTLAAPLVAWVASRLPSQRAHFKPWLLATWLILITHAILDLMTVYGTQILIPFVNKAYAVGSIFIIDPLYTLPIIFGLIATGIAKSDKQFWWNHAALIFSTLYLVWSVSMQAYVKGIAKESLQAQTINAEKILVTPTAFNTILWRVVAMTEEGYAEGFYSPFDETKAIAFKSYASDQNLYREWSDDWYVQRMEWFAQDFISMKMVEGKPVLSDLRMGQEPFYSFNFVLSREENPEHFRSRPDIKLVLAWVRQRMTGNPQGLQDYLSSAGAIKG